MGVAADAAGTLYIVDAGNHQILKVTSGIISTAAGTGIQGFSGDGGPAIGARLGSPEGAAADSSGNLYIADTLNHRVRKVLGGLIATVAGNGKFKFSGDGGPATSAALNGASGVAVDSAGNVFAADVGNHRIRRVSSGIITTVAGNGISGYSGDQGSAAGAELFFPSAVAADSAGNIYIADTLNNRIRKVSGGIITTVAGNGDLSFAGDNGPATSVALAYPAAIAVDSAGNIYFSDTGSGRVRKVTAGIISTIAGNGSNTYSGDGGQATGTGLDPNGLTVDSAGNIYIADTMNNRIRKVSGGIITTVAGRGVGGISGDGGPATSASLNSPSDVAVDSAGNIYIADTGNNRIRKVAGGIITTFVGNGVQGFGDGTSHSARP